MAKDKISDYSATASSNTDVGGVGIQGTNTISNIDNAMREIMTHLKEMSAGTYPLEDTTTFGDPADLTKRVRLDAGNVTAGNTRVLASPDADGTIELVNANITALKTAFTAASSSGPASLAFAEDTDNGSNKVTLKPPASIASDVDVTLPGVAATLATTDTAQTISGVKTFSAIPVLSGGAITFPGTQVASANANTLDDYDEKTFTPALSASGSTFSVAAATGGAIKIGKVVRFAAVVILNTSGNTLTGNALSMTGLPYTSEAVDTYVECVWANSTTSYISVKGLVDASSTTLTFRGITAAATSYGSSDLLANALLHATNGSVLIVYGTYFAAN